MQKDALLIKTIAEKNPYEKYTDLFERSKIRFTLIDNKGTVIYDSKNKDNEHFMDNHRDREEIKEAITLGEGFAIRKSKTLGLNYAYYALRFKNINNDFYILRTSGDYSKQLYQLKLFSSLLIIFFLILNYSIHFFYKNYIKRDLYNKINKMKTFLIDGEKLNSKTLKDEAWLLEFWNILKEWQKFNLENINSLDVERKILNTVITSVDSFIGLLDANGNFIIKNNSLDYLVLKDKYKYLEAIKHIEIVSIIKESLKENKDISKEIYISSIKEYFIVSIKNLKSEARLLITIKNITKTKKTIEFQKKFINNVGHELKTPLTNIKGYLIALEDAPDELKSEFLETVNHNVNKLENIISDFLNISKIENYPSTNLKLFSLEDLKKSVLKSLDMIILNKNANVSFEFHDDLSDIFSDFEKLDLILKNLIENSIVYNKSEIPKVNISIKENYATYSINVTDNGIGIPKNKLNKIFDRFYRIDKARTTNLGGTGLGLSIVKTLVEQLDGEISVLSEENKGSTFKIEIKKQ
ncbi:MAG: ATP-binding protein [Fusobacterium sp. JB020]|nr:ATP-binding protein [Fusobacterium sp. JB020]